MKEGNGREMETSLLSFLSSVIALFWVTLKMKSEARTDASSISTKIARSGWGLCKRPCSIDAAVTKLIFVSQNATIKLH